MEQNANVTENQNVVEMLKIDMNAHADFDAVADTAITTTNDLSVLINNVFGQVFKDYYGCTLEVTYMPNFCSYVVVPKLFFRILDKSMYNGDYITAFTPMSEVTANSVVARVQRLSKIAATSGIKVEITNEGKSILEDFVIKQNGINNQVHLDDKFDWTQAYNVIPDEGETYVRVFKLDIFKILQMIYGKKAEDGSKLFYQITPNGSIGAVNQYQRPTNWNLIIMRLNDKNLKYAAKQLGMYMQVSNSAGMSNVNTDRSI